MGGGGGGGGGVGGLMDKLLILGGMEGIGGEGCYSELEGDTRKGGLFFFFFF